MQPDGVPKASSPRNFEHLHHENAEFKDNRRASPFSRQVAPRKFDSYKTKTASYKTSLQYRTIFLHLVCLS